MKYTRKILDALNVLTEYAVSALLIVMVVVVFLQVIFRFILRASLPWSEELSRYVMVWIAFLGAAIGVRRKSHIGVEALIIILPKNWQKWAGFFVSLCSAVFFAFLVKYGRLILRTVVFQRSPAMELSMAIPYSAILVGGALMLVYSLYNAVEIATTRGEETKYP